jgi:hypothetical protein
MKTVSKKLTVLLVAPFYILIIMEMFNIHIICTFVWMSILLLIIWLYLVIKPFTINTVSSKENY